MREGFDQNERCKLRHRSKMPIKWKGQRWIGSRVFFFLIQENARYLNFFYASVCLVTSRTILI